MKKSIFFFVFVIAAQAGFCEDSIRADFLGKTEAFRDAHAVFEKSCLPCHSGQMPLPWYSRLPGIESHLKHEYREATEGLNLDAEVYVAGQTPSAATLNKIEAVLLSGSMPPRSYRMRHWSARVSKSEKDAILTWIAEERRQIGLFYQAESAVPAVPPKPAAEEEKVFNPFKPFDS